MAKPLISSVSYLVQPTIPKLDVLHNVDILVLNCQRVAHFLIYLVSYCEKSSEEPKK